MKEDRENMLKAKTALEITDAVGIGSQMNKLDVALEELTDLKGNGRIASTKILMFSTNVLLPEPKFC